MDTSFISLYVDRWSSITETIDTMSIDEQSTFADYQTQKICTECSIDIVILYASKLLETYKLVKGIEVYPHVKANIALVIKTLPDNAKIKKQLLNLLKLN
jgi:hypothetical protein